MLQPYMNHRVDSPFIQQLYIEWQQLGTLFTLGHSGKQEKPCTSLTETTFCCG